MFEASDQYLYGEISVSFHGEKLLHIPTDMQGRVSI